MRTVAGRRTNGGAPGVAETVRNYMSSPVVAVNADAPLAEADELLSEGAISAVAVEEKGRPVGVLSITDLFARAARRTPTGALVMPPMTVREAMTTGVVTIAPDASLEEACRLMIDRHIHRVFVAEAGQLMGVLSVHDVMQVVANLRVTTPLEALMTTSVIRVQVHDGIGIAAERLRDSRKHALVVFDDAWPVGTLAQEELLLARDWPDDTPVESWMNLRMLCLPVTMPAFRAAAHALTLNARHVLAMSDVRLEGIVSAIDFARALVP